MLFDMSAVKDFIAFMERHEADFSKVSGSRQGGRAVIQLYRSKPIDIPTPRRPVLRGRYDVYDFTPPEDPDGPRIEVLVPRAG